MGEDEGEKDGQQIKAKNQLHNHLTHVLSTNLDIVERRERPNRKEEEGKRLVISVYYIM